MDELKKALIGYGAWLMAGQLGQELSRDGPLAEIIGDADFAQDSQIRRAREVCGDWEGQASQPATPGRLRSIFSIVRYNQRYDETKRTRVEPYEMPRRVLSIDLTQATDQPAHKLWEEFWDRVGRLKPGWGLFETFTALMARYGWYVPGTLQDEMVSVYEQFKAVAALAHVLVPGEDDVLLVAGDLPGIQDMLYTVTSKGVAKALRGRSFYLQLVNDVIVRALLRDLKLPSVCVVYNAGGNFQLLARSTDEARLATLRREINRRLLKLHGGELYLALDWIRVPDSELATGAFNDHAIEVGDRLAREKLRAFADLAEENYQAVFGPTGFGGLRFCDVCHVDLWDGNRTRCDQCDSFGERIDEGKYKGEYGLARRIADLNENPRFVVHDLGGLQPVPDKPDWAGKPPWWTVMKTFGFRYEFAQQARPADHAFFYTVNDTDCVLEPVNGDSVYGFRFVANTTPRIRKGDDLERLQKLMDSDDEELRRGDIRNTTLMARWDRAGIDRYGVLRMDVDDLGTLFSSTERLENPSLPRRSALSAALDLFFEGWLNHLCEQAAREWQVRAGQVTNDPDAGQRQKLPYVIYAGGDDLFIVGPWDVLPVVAWHVRRDLASYVLGGYVDQEPELRHPPITVSAGIFAETAKFPLYQAAEQAREALDAAKRRQARRTVRGEQELATVKDAVNFLDTTVSWEEFLRAEELALRLARMIDCGVLSNGGSPDRAPHALIQLLAAVAREYAAVGGAESEKRLAYGRWMPLLAYGLRRMVERAPAGNRKLREQMMGLAGDALDLTRVEGAAQWHTIRFLGLPVRWAEFLIRKGG